MINVVGTDCYTTIEIIKEVGAGYNSKRIEYLRNVGLLPRPIKIGTGTNGTVGCYPPEVIPFLRKVDTRHKNGQTYKSILQDMKDVVFSLQAKVGRLQRLRLQEHIQLNLTTGELTEVSFKPTGEERKKIDPKEVQKRLDETEAVLRRLFHSRDCLSQNCLATIKSKIEEVQDLRNTKRIISRAADLADDARREGAEKAIRNYRNRHDAD